MSVNFPHFDPEGIAVALYNQLLTANGTNPGQYKFVKTDQRGDLPQNVPPVNQPYMALVEFGMSQVESQAQGLEKWLLHFRVLIYIRADAIPSAIPRTQLNLALLAIVNAMRSGPTFERQTLGGIVDNAWIEGDILMDTGVLDQQGALMIPIVVDVGL